MEPEDFCIREDPVKFREPFLLTDSEALALWRFLLECGYISYEFHEDVHKIWTRLEHYVNRHKQ